MKPFIEISWIDSESEIGWESPEKLKTSIQLIKSYGFLVKENEEFVVLAADRDKENDHYNRFIHIPKVNIKKKRKVKLYGK